MLILQIAKAMECLQNLDTSDTMLPEKGKVYSRQINLGEGDKQAYTHIELGENWQACRDHYIDSSVTTVNLIRSVGSGAFGDCFFAVSEVRGEYRSCVIKFFQDAEGFTTLEQATQEKEHWDQAYGKSDFETRVVKMGEDRGCLAMPYVDIEGVDRDACLADDEKELRECLDRFSRGNSDESFLLHRDVEWRHLGYLQGTLTLVDLGSVGETKEEGIFLEWKESCVNRLKDSKCHESRKRARKD